MRDRERVGWFFLFPFLGMLQCHGFVQIHTGDQNADPPIVAAQPAARIPVQFVINESGAPGITDGSDLEAIRNAFAAWQNVSSATISFVDGGTTTVTNADSADGTTLVTFQDTQTTFAAGAIALTINTINTTTGEIADSDLVFNNALSYSTTGDANAFDLFTVTLHEVGHICGLDHIALMSAIMFPFTEPGKTAKNALTQDDIAGLSSIYPAGSFATSTGTISGTVTIGGAGAFAVHVVAMDSNGRPQVSTVIDSSNGTYTIRGLPPGTYTVYAEPYDGPVTSQELTGGVFDRAFTTDFTTTFFAGTVNPAAATQVNVAAGADTPNTNIDLASLQSPINIDAIAAGSVGSTLTPSSQYPAIVSAGVQADMAISTSGAALPAGGDVQVSGPGVVISNLNISNTSATMTLTIAGGAVEGPRNVIFLDNAAAPTQNSTLSGGLIIGSAAGTGGAGDGTTAPPAVGRYQSGAGSGFIDIEWIDPEGDYDGIIVGMGAQSFPKIVVSDGQVIVDPSSGTEIFRGLNGRRLRITVSIGSRRFFVWASYKGTQFSLLSAAVSRSVIGADGINCVESFFGLGDCPEGLNPAGTSGSGTCFIATATYQTALAQPVASLRALRDQYLVRSRPGRAFVLTYYKTSPPVAQFLGHSTLLRGVLRQGLLRPATKWLEPLVRSARGRSTGARHGPAK